MTVMNGIQDLRERRNHLAKETRKVLDATPAGKWSDKEQTIYDAAIGEIEALDGQIKRIEKLLQVEADDKIAGAITERGARNARDLEETNPRRIFTDWIRRGDSGLSAAQLQAIRNTMSTTTASEGGHTVMTDVARTLLEALKIFGGMRSVAELLQTEQGNPMNWPTSDGTGETGELIGENTTATGADPTFATLALNVFKYSSKIIAVPFELLQDSNIDIEAFVKARIITRIGRITNTHFTVGTGSGQPRGVVVGSVAGKVGATGQTTSVIYDDLVDLEFSVDAAYRALGRCRYMMHDSSAKVVRKLKDSNGRPLWAPGYEQGITPGMPTLLNGYPVTFNNDMATMAANAKSILFGDFTYYKIRDVMQATTFRFTDSAYAKLGQVGFLAWMRAGGNFIDPSAGGAQCPIKHYANSAT